jgi:hypothetical protein
MTKMVVMAAFPVERTGLLEMPRGVLL